MAAERSKAPWARLRLRVPEDAAESLGVACIERGATGTITGQRDLRREPRGRPRSSTTRFEAYFPPRKARAGLEAALRADVTRLRAQHPRLDPAAVRLEPFPLPDYRPVLRGHFPPVTVGKRLLVCAPWASRSAIEAAGGHDRIVLRVEPGQAFGTGHHATTRGCLVAIERAPATSASRAGGSIRRTRGLDVGSGSGVLALAMRVLGVHEVVAVDNDPLARDATRKTVADGGGGMIRVARDLAAVRGRYDLVVANLFADLLVELAPRLAACLAPRGRLIVSGLLARQEGAVTRALEVQGLVVARRTSRATWVTLELDAAADAPARSSRPGRAEPARPAKAPTATRGSARTAIAPTTAGASRPKRLTEPPRRRGANR